MIQLSTLLHIVKPLKKTSPQAGYTLVELVMVMAIILILGWVAGPELLNWLPNHRLKSATQDLYGNMQRAKMGAIKTNSVWAIIFDPAGGSYILCSYYDEDGDCDDAGETQEKVITLSDYQSAVGYGSGSATTNATSGGGAFPADFVSFSGDVAKFAASGTAGTLGYVYLTNSNNSAYAIGVTTTAGMIYLKKWVNNAWLF